MKTYIITSQKDLGKFKDDYGYHIDGNAEFKYSADFTGRLKVDGYLYIKAGESIKAGEYIEVGESIKAGWSIKAGESIKAGGFIKAGGSIEAGEFYGISAGLSITCKGKLSFGTKAFAGICVWRGISDDEKTITCGKLEGGKVEYGILKETGLPEENTEEEIIIDGRKFSKNTIKEALKKHCDFN